MQAIKQEISVIDYIYKYSYNKLGLVPYSLEIA